MFKHKNCFIKILDAIYPISCSSVGEGICWKNTIYVNFMNWKKLAAPLFCGKNQNLLLDKTA